MGSSSGPEIILIPWDPESQEHTERLYQQRVACSWYEKDVESWRDRQRSGGITLQWIVLADTDPSKEAKLKEHVKAWPLEAKPLADSASSLGGKSRTPSPAKTFIPVGHISLNSESEEFAEVSSYKIAYFYVSSALRSSGLGRAAMDITEKTAISEPLCAKSLWLCTSSNVQQDPLVKVNKDKSTRLLTEDWYARRGYAVFHHQPRKWSSIAYDGVERWTDAVYMRKYIT